MAGAAGHHQPVERALAASLAYAVEPGGRLERLATEIPGYDRVNVNTLRQRIRESLKTEARAGGG